MTEERELLRHNNIIEAINNANTKEDLPNVTISTLSSFLASNLYFNNNHLSATLYATISSIIFEEGISDNVKTSLLTIMKDNYSEVSGEEIISKINTILSSPRISYLVDEIKLRIKKINELEARRYLQEHNKNISLINNANEIDEIPTITKAKLTRLISDNTKNN